MEWSLKLACVLAILAVSQNLSYINMSLRISKFIIIARVSESQILKTAILKGLDYLTLQVAQA